MRDWQASRADDTDATALLAIALQQLAHIRRGTGWAGETGRDQWEAMQATHAGSGRLLQACRAEGAGRELWHRARFEGGLTDGAHDAELHARFERLVAFDPWNTSPYHDRANQLLPCWHGSYAKLDAFARQSAERTAERYGQAFCADLYLGVMAIEDLADTDADRDRMIASLGDGARVFPAMLIANQQPQVTAAFDEREATRAAFAALPEIRLDAWGDRALPFLTHAWAEGSGPNPWLDRWED